jgi:precorrin-2/cobalt-factor-2 C20-methyltransferase
MQSGKTVHLIGIGPGDPDLVTIKAARIMREADILYVPQSNDQGRSVAGRIIEPYAERSKIRFFLVPMIRDKARLAPLYERTAREIALEAGRGKRTACATLGDPTLYSTAGHLVRHFERLGVAYEYVPGIPSYVAGANRAALPLADGAETFMVASVPEHADEVARIAAKATTVAFMKVAGRIRVLYEYVRTYAPHTAVVAHRVGLDGEQIIDLVAAARAGSLPEAGYLAVAIVRQAG